MADALEAHDFALTHGGRAGVSDLRLIESAIGRPYSGYHRPIHRKAAALLHSVVQNHGFIDANKRTAWLLVELMIERSGYRLDIPDDEPVDDVVVAVASGQLDFPRLAAWFAMRLVRLNP
ncbi:type II toxin-antitoxin system death-on-curing family toxin [Wenxinia saemankumensis]|uniref:type II toxin-antitoxin system death-on-curing family toxin n=1 Tax=Wenxinia saemankumensis TaxID=1447782 RepID=UPI000934A79B|nr:type II toxin-antitoxin system death-on-curing family toxin [Wenxinia saemankumensis]